MSQTGNGLEGGKSDWRRLLASAVSSATEVGLLSSPQPGLGNGEGKEGVWVTARLWSCSAESPEGDGRDVDGEKFEDGEKG